MCFFLFLPPPLLDDSIWQELSIKKKNPDCLCATPANLSGEMMFFAQQFLFSTECQHKENSWSDFLFSIKAQEQFLTKTNRGWNQQRITDEEMCDDFCTMLFSARFF